MSLFVGLKIEDDVDYEKLIEALKSLGVKMIEESDTQTKSCVYAMGRKSKYLATVEEFTDEEILEEYSKRNLQH